VGLREPAVGLVPLFEVRFVLGPGRSRLVCANVFVQACMYVCGWRLHVWKDFGFVDALRAGVLLV
jgi:hypothetical protein